MTIDRPIVFFDLETTGIDKKNDRIVEISMAKVLDNDYSTPPEVRTRLVNPTIPIPKEASAVHDIFDEDVKDAPTFKQIAKGVLQFIEMCDLAGFNLLLFDVPILYEEFLRAGIEWDWKKHNIIDVRNIYVRKEERNLAAAYKFYTGESMENAHSAEADILATIKVFEKQCEKYDLPDTAEEMALYSNFDRIILDLAGFFTLDSENDIIFAAGKHKDKKAKNHKDYLLWMLGADFNPDTKEIATKILKS